MRLGFGGFVLSLASFYLLIGSSCKSDESASRVQNKQLGNSYDMPHFRIAYKDGDQWRCLASKEKGNVGFNSERIELSLQNCYGIGEALNGSDEKAKWDAPAEQAWMVPDDKSILMDFNWGNERGESVGRSMSIGLVKDSSPDPRSYPVALVPNGAAIHFDSMPLSGGQLFFNQRSSCLGVSCEGAKSDGSACTGDFKLAQYWIRMPNVSAQNPLERKKNEESIAKVCTNFSLLKLKQVVE